MVDMSLLLWVSELGTHDVQVYCLMLILVDVFCVFFKGMYVHKGIEFFVLHVLLCC
jgi:hypothetical protein